MVKPGIIYHRDTRGNEGFFNEEEMIREGRFEEMFKVGLLKTPFCHTLHYGTSVFEGVRAVPDINNGKLYIITFDKHLDRLMNSMEYLYLTKPEDIELTEKDLKFLDMTKEEISDTIIETVRANILVGYYTKEQGCYIRPIAYRDDIFDENGQHNPSLGVYSLKHDVVFEIMSFFWEKYVDEPEVSIYQESIESPLRHIKAGANYGFGGRCKNWARIHGFEEAILIDTEQNVLEGSGENLFIFKDGEIITPKLNQSILPGTKRNLVMQIAKNLSMDIVERKIPLEEFLEAESAAFSGTATGFEGVKSAYNPQAGAIKEFNLEHKLLKQLAKEYDNLIEGGEVDERNKELQEEARTEVPFSF